MHLTSLQSQIEELLESSGISDHTKSMTRILLPIMDENEMKKIFKSLIKEREELTRLNEQKKLLNLKYTVMSEKLSSFNKNKND